MLFPHPQPPEGKMLPGENAPEGIVLALVHPGSKSPTSQADGVARAGALVGLREGMRHPRAENSGSEGRRGRWMQKGGELGAVWGRSDTLGCGCSSLWWLVGEGRKSSGGPRKDVPLLPPHSLS